MTTHRAWILLAACLMNPLAAASANVVTDWDEKAVAFIQPRMVPPAAYRAMAIMHIAMFDAVNSIEPLYRSYQAQLPATPDMSKDAAAAAAAGTVLKRLLPDAASDIQSALTSYLAAIPDGDAKLNGIKLGEAVASKCLEARGSDGASVADAYRPVTTPLKRLAAPPHTYLGTVGTSGFSGSIFSFSRRRSRISGLTQSQKRV